MTSLFKIYKSNQVKVGNHRQIEFKKAEPEKIEPTKDEASSVEKTIDSHEQQRFLSEVMEQAENEKEMMLAKAREQAEKIIIDAQEESQKLFEETKQKGYQQGFDEGFEKGQQQGYDEMTELIDEAAVLKQEVLDEKETMLQNLEKEVIELVIKTARRVIQSELQDNQELIFNLIEEGLRECNYTENLIIHVSEMDYDLVYAYKNRIYLMTDGIRDIDIRSDPSMGPGSVIIETVSGQVDASVETQIKKIESIFSDLLQSEG